MKKFITFLSLTTIGVGSLIYIMQQTKRRRRRLLEEKKTTTPQRKVANDFGGTVPGPLYKYLRSLGEEVKIKDGYVLYGYQRVLEFSGVVSKYLEGDVLVVLGTEQNLSKELGKNTYLLYSKAGYPDNLILVTLDKDTGNLEYYKDVEFDVLG